MAGVYQIDYPEAYELMRLEEDGEFKQVVVMKSSAQVFAISGRYTVGSGDVDFDRFIEIFNADGTLDANFSHSGMNRSLPLSENWGKRCIEYQSHQSWGTKYFCRL